MYTRFTCASASATAKRRGRHCNGHAFVVRISGRIRAVLWIAAAVVMLAATYWGLQRFLSEQQVTGETHSLTFQLYIPAILSNEQPPTLKVVQGDTVTLHVRSERAGEIHVHGYEKKLTLEPGGVATLSFVAQNPGLFALHLHDPDETMHGLATLEVRPR